LPSAGAGREVGLAACDDAGETLTSSSAEISNVVPGLHARISTIDETLRRRDAPGTNDQFNLIDATVEGLQMSATCRGILNSRYFRTSNKTFVLGD
jgi:hypothetical protein